ncbi:PWWP domain-containing protein [Actinidia chinensis var. chinensis]|uniref:PWWP domain-containing protein n=1 Tax=Actinidia chinensis var. chinensis TaxID=1590841 RepID=A0A2R6R326_ACTCC|nr:PWWP domain-containing protein [Actinidia chinensis var. chinensis]
MISVMSNNDFELDPKPDVIADETQPKSRVSGDLGAVSSANNGDGDKGSSSNLIGSLENGVSLGVGVDDSDKAIYDDSHKDNPGYEGIRVSEELENRALEIDVDGRVLVGDEEKARVSEGDLKGIKGDMISESSDIRNEGVDINSRASDRKFDVRNEGERHSRSRLLGKGHVEVGKSSASMFDEFGKGEIMGAGLSTSVGYGYEIGDMIWGKVKSHPWWPGHIYNEAFASPSVRRSKRAGHVLVAFFGDSSYGWFEPDELIPFDANFAEKSKQTNLRNFVNAVEEAVDEVSRRRGLGLACRCRNPYNFRATNVQGYFAVDVDNYELGGVYSVRQIRKARDSFQPRDTVAFVKQLALMPRGDWSIDFISNKATVLAYRKAVFEEFDVTYAQAFGQEPVRPTRESMLAAAQRVRAPLSGPLVIAETLGKRKSSTKPKKVKEQENKDRYLFKRRDEPSEPKIQQMGPGTSPVQGACVAGSAAVAAGDVVLQKRASDVPIKKQLPAKLERMAMDGGSVSSRDSAHVGFGTTEDNMSGSLADGSKVGSPSSFADSFPVWQSPAETTHLLEPESSFNKTKGALLGANEHAGYIARADPIVMDGSGSSGKARFHQSPSLLAKVEEMHGQGQVHSLGSGGHVLPTADAKFRGQDSRIHVDTGTKKAKLLKRPVGELGAEEPALGVKKKKRKKELGAEFRSDRASTGKGGASFGRAEGASVQVGLPPREDSQLVHHKTDNGAGSSCLPESAALPTTIERGNTELKLPQLLGGLQALALNPFHGADSKIGAIVQQAFLKFRSAVYQKSLVLSIPTKTEPEEVHAPTKSPAGSALGSDNSSHENTKDLPSLRPPKLVVRPDDPTKSGRKRGPSDRQEELATKRIKKIKDLKSLATEKKVALKTLEAKGDGKETVALRPPKPVQLDFVKKTGTPAMAREPTVLVMKFPPNTSLPSGSELKARLARFGPLDHSATRVFWQSFSCRVVFLHKSSAEAAYRHLTGRNTLFGHVNVRCHIRPLSESKVQIEDAPMDSAVEQRPPPAQQSVVQLKSCLKKPTGDEAGTTAGGGGRGTPRVKFVLEEGEQMMIGNKNNNASFGDGGASSSSHGMDFNSKNFLRVIPPHPLPLLPLPPATAQFPNSQINKRYIEVAPPRNTHNLKMNTAPAGPGPTEIDIAPQMLSLLVKCNDLVTNLSNFLGYEPYHPL